MGRARGAPRGASPSSSTDHSRSSEHTSTAAPSAGTAVPTEQATFSPHQIRGPSERRRRAPPPPGRGAPRARRWRRRHVDGGQRRDAGRQPRGSFQPPRSRWRGAGTAARARHDVQHSPRGRHVQEGFCCANRRRDQAAAAGPRRAAGSRPAVRPHWWRRLRPGVRTVRCGALSLRCRPAGLHFTPRASATACLAHRLTGLHAVFGPNIELPGGTGNDGAGQYGNLILSRFPVSAWTNTKLEQVVPGGETRGVLVARSIYSFIYLLTIKCLF
eukprot:SAG31_NODE_37_length_31616_cov_38.688359_6_plen_272_part_00